MVDVTEILAHWYAGRSKNQIAESLGLDRKTVRKYLAPAEAEGLAPGGPPVSAAEWRERAAGWFPELADARLRQVTWGEIGKHHEFITGQLKAGVTVKTIWQRLCDEHGLAASYASLRRYVAANVPEEVRREQVRVLRLAPRQPGEEAQIDYGQLGRWADPVTGVRHVIWAFVMVLCCSRHMFVRPVIRLGQHAWTECHVRAFEFFGGVPARLVPEYVPRNIFGVLCPPGLCDRRRHGGACGQAAGSRCRRCRPHNDQSEVSQLSRVSSVCQMGLTRGSAEVPGGWVARSASILVLVLISA